MIGQCKMPGRQFFQSLGLFVNTTALLLRLTRHSRETSRNRFREVCDALKNPSPCSSIQPVMMGSFMAALVVALLFAETSFGHAILLAGKPAVNGVVDGPNIDVELRFNSRIDAARSRLTLVLPDQTARPLQVQPSSTPASVGAHATGLGPGEYRLRWQVLANDGHITRGEFVFHVK